MRNVAFLAAVVAFSASVSADDMVARNGKDYVRLTEADCPAAILDQLPPNIRENFKAASAFVDGKRYDACWALRPDGVVYLHYADGDGGLVPAQLFAQEKVV